MKVGFLVTFVFLLITACKPEVKQHSVQFYYWKSKVDIGATEQQYFEELNSEKLYIRFFDVILKDGQPEPTATLRKFDTEKLQTEYIPVIYFINEVFKGISEVEIHNLAENVFNLTEKLAVETGIRDFREIQLDCDWTKSTKDNYFLFLKELKEISEKQVSSTLRLHQVKFKEEEGIPPADKVYLMCYATSSPIEEIEKNSILDLGLLKDYLKNIDKYPLNLDVALPVYSWGIVTNHLGKKKLINGVSEVDLSSEDFKKIRENVYQTQNDVFLRGIYLSKGFEVKLETISPELLRKSREFLDSKIKSEFEIVYYHLDALFLKEYTIQELK